MRTTYRVLAYLLALSVAVQASLIAFGAFALENNIDNGPVTDGDTTGVTLHHSFAYIVLLLAVALLAVSFGAKVTYGVRWAAIPLSLIVVQFFLAYAAYSAAIIGVLHGLNALAIFAVALLAGRRVPKTAPIADIRNSVLINRPIGEVFDFAVDTRNEFKWNPKVRAMTKLTDGPIGLGTRMAARWTMSGHIELECTEYERPYVWTWANGGPIAVRVTVRLSEEAGGTRLRAAFVARAHGLARLFFPVFVRLMRKDEARNMGYLKACLESGQAAQASPQSSTSPACS